MFLLHHISKNFKTFPLSLRKLSSKTIPPRHIDKYSPTKDPGGNCLTYALNIKGVGNALALLPPPGAKTPFNNLRHYCNTISDHYSAPDLCVPCPEIPEDTLPPEKEGYYIAAMYEAEEKTHPESKLIVSLNDYHFVRETEEGGFAHRRGQQKPTLLDASGSLILNPAKADMLYDAEDEYPPTLYRFVGYLYIQEQSKRPSRETTGGTAAIGDFYMTGTHTDDDPWHLEE